mmetsp:Transcript_106037/g.182935  ORF Transcript_106037/g.182935 Transcript_106037/m.182935 type:complete len:217 (-) Transcript_106037:18-668(-)
MNSGGLVNVTRDSCCRALVLVAENIIVCRPVDGSRSRISSISLWNPSAKSRSASSTTSAFSPLYFHPLQCIRWSSRRPGVAITMSTPLVSIACSCFTLTPPVMTVYLRSVYFTNLTATSCICTASSFVGAMTMQPVPFAGSFSSRFKAGIRNANVFPDPVLACPMTSCPKRRGGMHFCWMGVMVANPNSSTACLRFAWSCKDANCSELGNPWLAIA